VKGSPEKGVVPDVTTGDAVVAQVDHIAVAAVLLPAADQDEPGEQRCPTMSPARATRMIRKTYMLSPLSDSASRGESPDPLVDCGPLLHFGVAASSWPARRTTEPLRREILCAEGSC